MDFGFLFANALNGVVYGAFLLLTSLGLSLVFGLGRVVNFAHGALYALGGYALIAVMERFGAPYWLALALAPLLVVPVALTIERTTIHPIRSRPEIYTLLVTFGMSFMLIGAVEYLWGTGTTLVQAPAPFTGTVRILGNEFPVYRLAAAGLSLAVSGGEHRREAAAAACLAACLSHPQATRPRPNRPVGRNTSATATMTNRIAIDQSAT